MNYALCRGVVFDGNETHYLEPPGSSQPNATSFPDSVTSGNIDLTGKNWEVMLYKHADFKKNLTCG